MVRLIHCVHKRDDLSLQEFRRYWESADLAQSIERMARLLGARGYAINVTLAVDANQMLTSMRPMGEQFDGVIEYWWDSAAHVVGIARGTEFQSLRAAHEAFLGEFLALGQSVIFFTEGNRQSCQPPTTPD